MCFCVYFIKLIVKFKILDQKGYQQNSKLEKNPTLSSRLQAYINRLGVWQRDC